MRISKGSWPLSAAVRAGRSIMGGPPGSHERLFVHSESPIRRFSGSHAPEASLREKQAYLKRGLAGLGTSQIKDHPVENSVLERFFRGDRRLRASCAQLGTSGARFDSWRDISVFLSGPAAFEKTGVDPTTIWTLEPDASCPGDHIRTPFTGISCGMS